MNRRDQELLERQLHGLTVAPRHSALIMLLTVLAVFLAGLTIGDLWSVATSEPERQVVAANDLVLPHHVPNVDPWR